MSTPQGRIELVRLESDLAARMEMLFRRCPELHGFSVQQGSSVDSERVAQDLQAGLLRRAKQRCFAEIAADEL